MPSNQKGLLIAVEGIDGSGKSTLISHLVERLQKSAIDVIATKEPGGTALGQRLRTLLLTPDVPVTGKAEYLLFAADRAQHMAAVIIPALAQGTCVISDRMGDSSIVYQGYARGIDHDIITAINRWIMGPIQVDLTVYVRTSVHEAQKRMRQRTALNRFEDNSNFLSLVADGFEQLYKDRTDVVVLDGLLPINLVAIQAYDAIMQTIMTRRLHNQLVSS